MGKLLTADFGRSTPVVLSKRQLALHLRRSTRWIEQQMAAGLPSQLDGQRRIFDLTECLAWLESRKKGAA